MIRTALCDLLDIQHPILQGGMAWAANAELAAAVSNAGGLGIVGAGDQPPEVVRQALRRARELTQSQRNIALMQSDWYNWHFVPSY